MKNIFWLFVGTSLLILSCSENKILVEAQFLLKCIEAHGGMEHWKTLQTIDYTKEIVLYNEKGAVEKEIEQKHHYSNTPELSGTIEWSDSVKHKIVYREGQAYNEHGTESEEPSLSALNTFNSAYYVLNMPWKLKDGSADIFYRGIDTLFNGKIVHTLKVEYPSEQQTDVWEYYLDQNDYYLVANMVKHGSTYSLITNDEFAHYKGLKFNSKRTSYMVDSLGQVLYVRAKYDYKFVDL